MGRSAKSDFYQLFRRCADQTPCFELNTGARLDLEGPQKKAGRHRLAGCVIVARDGIDLRADLFTERLGVPVNRHEAAGPLAANPAVTSEPGIQLVATNGDP